MIWKGNDAGGRPCGTTRKGEKKGKPGGARLIRQSQPGGQFRVGQMLWEKKLNRVNGGGRSQGKHQDDEGTMITGTRIAERGKKREFSRLRKDGRTRSVMQSEHTKSRRAPSREDPAYIESGKEVECEEL